MDSPPDVAVLCGGAGTRLQSALPGLPKSMAPIHGRPFIEHLALLLARVGFVRLVLLTGVGADLVAAHFQGRAWGIEIACSREVTPLGTAGAVRHAAACFRTATILLLNGDSWVRDPDWPGFLAFHHRHPSSVSLLAVPADGRDDAGCLDLDRRARVLGFSEKAHAAALPHISAGIYLLPRGRLDAIPADRACSLETEMIPQWISERQLFGYSQATRLLDIGTPERLRQAQADSGWFPTVAGEGGPA